MTFSESELTQLQILLDRVGSIDLKYQESRQKNKFNIFNLIAKKFDEVNLHSRFIYELLNPKGSHGYKTCFLEKLLFHLQISDFQMEGVQVYREYRNIDLLIKNNKQAIVIENKLWAVDQQEQLQRYYELLKQEGYQDIRIFYLSIDGKEPSDHSIGTLNLLPNWNSIYSPISYDYDISQWIESCIKEAYNMPTLRETLVQYKSLINEIAGKTMNREEMVEMVDFISKGDNAFQAKKVKENWVHVRWYTEWYFWQDLEKVIKVEYPILDLQKYSSDKLDDLIHGSRNRSPWYGLMFKIGEYLGDDACLFIERGNDDIYYGLTMVRDNSKEHNKEPKFAELASKIEAISEWGCEDHWIGGNYFHPEINFNSFSNHTTLKLLNDDFRNNYINKLWPTIKEFVAKAKTIIANIEIA